MPLAQPRLPSAANQGSALDASCRWVSSPLVMAPENHSFLNPIGSSFFSVVSEPETGRGCRLVRRRWPAGFLLSDQGMSFTGRLESARPWAISCSRVAARTSAGVADDHEPAPCRRQLPACFDRLWVSHLAIVQDAKLVQEPHLKEHLPVRWHWVSVLCWRRPNPGCPPRRMSCYVQSGGARA